MFVIISFPKLFDLYEEFKKLGGGGILSPPNLAWKQLLPLPPCVDAPDIGLIYYATTQKTSGGT